MEGNKPEKKFRAGAVNATVWSNQAKNKAGQPVEFKSISIERGYKDKNNEWKNTASFRTQDIPKLTLVLTKAYEYLVMSGYQLEEELVV